MELALSHLLLRLRPLHRALRIEIARRDGDAQRLHEAGALPYAITRAHADALLDRVAEVGASITLGAAAMSDDELDSESKLRARAETQGSRLPLDELAALGLDGFEQETLVLCSAVELDRDYERIFAFVHDDGARRLVSTDLASGITASSLPEQVARRAALGPHGRLRRLGLIELIAGDNGLRDELRLSPAARAALFGSGCEVAVEFVDRGEVITEPVPLVPADRELVARAARELAHGGLDLVGVWGRRASVRDVVTTIAHDAGRPLRRLLDAASLTAAAVLGTWLWLDLDGGEPPAELVERCARSRIPLLVSGENPWRPTDLLAARRYAEIPLFAPDAEQRREAWQQALPEVSTDLADLTASAFVFDATETRAASATARAMSALQTNGHAVTPSETLRAACLAVARKHGERHTTLITPHRTVDDLVLAPELRARVLDLVHNFRALPRVMAEWGFARKVSGAGLKGLFTGEPGTGKTLAAEVVAQELGLPMLRVDLARVVSKWIGETEKNLDDVFGEARDSHALLFFDEAEALFGARGDVRHGTDRYANLEVSYLLQRFEDHAGIVILATNLRDKIDPAFMRRFHVVVGFPRPGEAERRRMWTRVFARDVPIEGEIDLATLARLDLTGAGIVGAAQTAALFAARHDEPVTMRHVVRGLVRQFQREARVLSPHELGPHAIHAH